MFNPLYLYCGHRPNFLNEDYLRSKGFTLVNVDDPNSLIARVNPPVIVYESGLTVLGGAPHRERLYPPRGVGVVYLERGMKGHVHGLPHPEEFLKWFLGEEIVYWNAERGNFRAGLVQHFDARVVG